MTKCFKGSKMARLNIALLSSEDSALEVEPRYELDTVGQQVEDDLLQAHQNLNSSNEEGLAVEDAIQAIEYLQSEQLAIDNIKKMPEEATQAAMESIRRNVKNILKSVGMESASKTTDSVSSGGVREFIRKIWESIKAAWFRIVDTIRNFFNNLSDGSLKIKERAEIIQKEAQTKIDNKSEVKTDASFEAPNSVKTHLRLNNKPLSPSDLSGQILEQGVRITGMIADIAGQRSIEKYQANILEISKDIATSKYTSEQAIKDAGFEMVTKTFDFVAKDFNKVVSAGVHSTERFISDKQFTMNLSDFSIKLENAKGYKELENEHEVLSLNDISRTCHAVINTMGQFYKDAEKRIDDFEKFSSSIEKLQDKTFNDNLKTDGAIEKTQLAYVSGMIRFFMGVAKTVSTEGRMLDVQVNKAALDWCVASLRLYK